MELEDLSLHPGAPAQPVTPRGRELAQTLRELDLDYELLENYRGAKQLRDSLEGETENQTPANQVAQVYNTCTNILDRIIKMQEALYNIERIKSLESSMIQALRLTTPEVQDAFLAEYRKLAR